MNRLCLCCACGAPATSPGRGSAGVLSSRFSWEDLYTLPRSDGSDVPARVGLRAALGTESWRRRNPRKRNRHVHCGDGVRCRLRPGRDPSVAPRGAAVGERGGAGFAGERCRSHSERSRHCGRRCSAGESRRRTRLRRHRNTCGGVELRRPRSDARCGDGGWPLRAAIVPFRTARRVRRRPQSTHQLQPQCGAELPRIVEQLLRAERRRGWSSGGHLAQRHRPSARQRVPAVARERLGCHQSVLHRNALSEWRGHQRSRQAEWQYGANRRCCGASASGPLGAAETRWPLRLRGVAAQRRPHRLYARAGQLLCTHADATSIAGQPRSRHHGDQLRARLSRQPQRNDRAVCLPPDAGPARRCTAQRARPRNVLLQRTSDERTRRRSAGTGLRCSHRTRQGKSGRQLHSSRRRSRAMGPRLLVTHAQRSARAVRSRLGARKPARAATAGARHRAGRPRSADLHCAERLRVRHAIESERNRLSHRGAYRAGGHAPTPRRPPSSNPGRGLEPRARSHPVAERGRGFHALRQQQRQRPRRRPRRLDNRLCPECVRLSDRRLS